MKPISRPVRRGLILFFLTVALASILHLALWAMQSYQSGKVQDGLEEDRLAKKGGALTDEQKKQVEELMKANQQSTDTQSNTTQSEQKATQNKGTGATKPW